MSDEESKKAPASVRDMLPDDEDDHDGRIGEDELDEEEDELDEDAFDDDLDDLDDFEDEAVTGARGAARDKGGRRAPRGEGEVPEDEREGFWERNVGRRLEGLMPDAMKRAVVGSLGSLFMSEDGLKQQLTELRLPKEIINFILQQSNNTKREFMRIVAREIREFLEHTDFYDELRKILTSLSFEIRTEVRLIPNDQAFVKPEIKNRVRVKRKGKPLDEADEFNTAGVPPEADAEADKAPAGEERQTWTERLIGREKRREKPPRAAADDDDEV